MSYGTFAYEKADPGNLNAYLGEKIMSAAKMAAEERKFRDEEIKTLANKTNRTEEEEERLKQLTGERSTRKKGKFFGKALAHEFGGDLFRRTKGTFSRDPKETEDPALTKRQRFSALIRGEEFVKPAEDTVKPDPFKQLELFPQEKKNAVEVKDEGLKNWIEKAFGAVQNSYDRIGDRLSSLTNTEKQNTTAEEKTTGVIENIVSGFDELRSFFNKNNKLKDQEIKIEQQELDLKLDQKEEAEMTSKESSIESGEDLTSTFDYSFGNKQEDSQSEKSVEGGKGIFGRLFDAVDLLDDIPFGRRRRGRNRRGGRRKGFRSRFKGFGSRFKNPFKKSPRGGSPLKSFRKARFGRGGRGGASGDGGLIKPIDTQYSEPIGPLPMNSREPWVSSPEGMPGISGYSPFIESIPKLSEGGIVLPKKKKNIEPQNKISETEKLNNNYITNKTKTKVDAKLSNGGIVTNPTITTLGQESPTAVVPLNRTVGKPLGKIGGNDKNIIEPLSKAIQLPTQAAGGLLLSVFTSALNNLGGMSVLFKPFFSTLLSPLARVFGLPANIVNTMMGTTGGLNFLGNFRLGDFLTGGKGKKKKGASSGGGGGGGTGDKTTPGAAELAGTQVQNEVDLAKNSHAHVGFTDVYDPTGSINKRGRPHKGIDIGTSGQKGYMVGMKRTGTVKDIAFDAGGYGHYVDIQTADAVYRFAHLKSVNPELKRGGAYTGQTIGEIGTTGRSSGEHLHFEKIVNGKQVDPRADAISLLEIGKKTKSGFTPQPALRIPSSGATQQNTPSILPPGSSGVPTPKGAKSKVTPSVLNLNSTGNQQTFSGLTTPSYLNATSSPFSTANPFAPLYGGNW